MRQAFDAAFVVAMRPSARGEEHVLAVRVAGDPYALRIRDVAGLDAGRTVVPLPTQVPALLGLAGVRGTLVPVYSLAELLGYGRGPDERWLVLSRAAAPIALAFDRFEGLQTARTAELIPTAESGGVRQYVNDALRVDATLRWIVDLPAIQQAVARQASSTR